MATIKRVDLRLWCTDHKERAYGQMEFHCGYCVFLTHKTQNWNGENELNSTAIEISFYFYFFFSFNSALGQLCQTHSENNARINGSVFFLFSFHLFANNCWPINSDDDLRHCAYSIGNHQNTHTHLNHNNKHTHNWPKHICDMMCARFMSAKI